MSRAVGAIARVAAIGWCCGICLAEPPELVTDRPDQTESSVVVPPRHIQVESGWTRAREDEQGLRTDTDEVLSTLVRIGLVPRAELRLGWGGAVREEGRGSGVDTEVDGSADTDLGIKVALAAERGRRPEIALIAGTTLPTGADALTSDRADPYVRASLSHTLSDRLSLGYNAGALLETVADGVGERDSLSSAFYTAALGIGLGERLGAFVELFGDWGLSAGGPPSHSFDGGVTYLVRPNLQLDLAAGVGLSSAADDAFAGVGLSVRLPR